MRRYGKMHYWGEMFEDVIDFREFFNKRKIIKYIKECIVLIYSGSKK